MNDEGAKVRKLQRQQNAIARFGSFALRESDLLKVLTEAARVCAESLSAPFAKEPVASASVEVEHNLIVGGINVQISNRNIASVVTGICTKQRRSS